MTTHTTPHARFLEEFAQLREPVKVVRPESLHSHRTGLHVKTTIAFVAFSIILGTVSQAIS